MNELVLEFTKESAVKFEQFLMQNLSIVISDYEVVERRNTIAFVFKGLWPSEAFDLGYCWNKYRRQGK